MKATTATTATTNKPSKVSKAKTATMDDDYRAAMAAMDRQANALCASRLPWIRKRGQRMRELLDTIHKVTDATDTYTFAMTVHIAARDVDSAWRLARLAMRLPPVRTGDARYLRVTGARTNLRKVTT